MAKAALPITQELAGWIYECWMKPDTRRFVRLEQEALAAKQFNHEPHDAPEAYPSTRWILMHQSLNRLRDNSRDSFKKLVDNENELPFFLAAAPAHRHSLIDVDVSRLKYIHDDLVTILQNYESAFLASIEDLKVKPYPEWKANLKSFYHGEAPVVLPGTSPFWTEDHTTSRQFFYDELVALEKEFGEVYVTTEAPSASEPNAYELMQGTFSVITKEPVVFDDPNDSQETIDLGKFEIHFRSFYGIDRSPRTDPPLVRAITPNYPIDSDDVTHPNVSDHVICMGNAATALGNALSEQRFTDAALLINSVLFYDGEVESPYRSLSRWHGTGKSCTECGVTIYDEDYLHYCQQSGCEDSICGDCTWTCSNCDEIFCSYHVKTCSHDGVDECYTPESRFCDRCLSAHNAEVLFALAEKRQNEQDLEAEENESPIFGASGQTTNELESATALSEYQPL